MPPPPQKPFDRARLVQGAARLDRRKGWSDGSATLPVSGMRRGGEALLTAHVLQSSRSISELSSYTSARPFIEAGPFS
jgi:hypothetical protein